MAVFCCKVDTPSFLHQSRKAASRSLLVTTMEQPAASKLDLSDELLQRLRGWVLAVLIVRFGIELWVDSQARPETKRGALLVVAESAARCAVQVALVLAFCVCPWGRFTALRRWRHDETATNSKPYEAQQDTLDKYDCPAVGPTRSAFALEKAHEKRLVGLDLTTAAYKNMAATLTTSWA